MVRYALILLLASACDPGGVDANLDARALVTVSGGQFFAGRMPAAASGAPAIVDVTTRNHAVFAGQRGKKLTGHMEPTARAVALGFDGDIGYWIVTAGNPDEVDASLLQFGATIDLSPALPLGSQQMLFAAVDGRGEFGARTPVEFVVRDTTVQGLLIVTLKWDTEADLDLHVVEPDGTEVWSHNINDYVPPPPGSPIPPDDVIKGGGILDFDSNSQCQIDGRRQEDVTYQTRVPSGHYRVRVETFSLCAAPDANWTVDVVSAGNPIAQARGESTDADVRLPHGAGAGTTAVEFDIP
jgi:hypothetical protein